MPPIEDDTRVDEAADEAAELDAFALEATSDHDDDTDHDITPAPKPADTVAAPAAATPAPQAPAAPAAPAEPVTDPYAGLPPAVRDALAEIPTLRHEVVSNRGRIAGLNAALEEARSRAAPAAPVQAPPGPGPAPAPKNDRLEAIRGELPEVADAIESVVAEALQSRAPAPAAKAPAAAPAQAPAPAADPELDLLDREHPGWAPKFDSTDFKLWLSQQPQAYQQEVMTTARSGVVITALTKFDKFQAEVAASAQVGNKRAVRMAAAATPQGSGVRPAARSSEPQTEEEGFEAEANKRPRR
jgi:hypothetical protein